MMRAAGPLLAAVLLIVSLAAIYVMHHRRAPFGTNEEATAGTQDIGGPFDLIDSDGRRVSDRDFRGKWLLVFFGYTHCPDVCPTTLNDIAATLAQLGELASAVQPLFITVDPERDTPQVLAEYTAAFDSRIKGLTGTPEQIAAAAKAYGIYYAKRPAGDDYYMDHSAIIHAVRPDGRYATFFFTTTGPAEMAKRLRETISRN